MGMFPKLGAGGTYVHVRDVYVYDVYKCKHTYVIYIYIYTYIYTQSTHDDSAHDDSAHDDSAQLAAHTYPKVQI